MLVKLKNGYFPLLLLTLFINASLAQDLHFKDQTNTSAKLAVTQIADSFFNCPEAPQILSGRYGAQFNCLFNDLMTRYWQENGDWLGDMDNDATGYAPELLFNVWKLTKNETHYKRAMQTLTEQKRFLKKIIDGTEELNGGAFLNFTMGMNGFLSCVKYARPKDQTACRLVLGPALRVSIKALQEGPLGQSLLSRIPQADEIISIPFTYGRLAVAAAQYAQTFPKGANRFLFNQKAQELIKIAEQKAPLDSQGLFTGIFPFWDQVAILAAYAILYKNTEDPAYLQKIQALLSSLDSHRRFRDFSPLSVHETFTSSPLTPPGTGTAQYHYVYASAHQQSIEAYLYLLETNAKSTFLPRAEGHLDFAKNYLTVGSSEDLLSNNVIRNIYHFTHDLGWSQVRRQNPDGTWIDPPTSSSPRKSQRYCTGESFFILSLILKYHQLTEQK